MATQSLARSKSVLIAGGSVAGPATAFWLNRYGFHTTVVERWHELRPCGQNIDVRDYGRVALDAMGLTAAVLARNTGEKGTRFLDRHGNIKATIAAGPNSPTSDLEILRGDIGQILYDATKDETEWVFNDYIAGIDEREDGVVVEFASGKKREFGLVIIADGVASRTRKLVFGSEGYKIRNLALYTAYFSCAKSPSIQNPEYWHIVHLPHRRVVSARPDPYNTSRISLSVWSAQSQGIEKLPMPEQIQWFKSKFTGTDIYSRAVMAGLEKTDDLYVDYLGQVFADEWSTPGGRVGMVGDAAYCASPLSGVGTSLALAGAYVLAGELAKHWEEPKVGMKKYQEIVGVFVKDAQKVGPTVPKLAHPEGEFGIWVIHTFVRVLVLGIRVWGWLGLDGLLERIMPVKKKVVLPDYTEYLVKRN